MSKDIRDCFGFALVRYVISPETHDNVSTNQIQPIATWSFPALPLHWLLVIFSLLYGLI